MIHEVIVLESALKHGYAEDDVRHAWCHNVDDRKMVERRDQSVHARVGCTAGGVMLEMLGAWSNAADAWMVFHAMRPGVGIVGYMGLE